MAFSENKQFVPAGETPTVEALQSQRLHRLKDADDALSFQTMYDSQWFSVTYRARTGGVGGCKWGHFFLLAYWACTLSYVFYVCCRKSGKLNDGRVGNLPRHSHRKPGNDNFSLWTLFFPPKRISEKGVKLCLAVSLQRKSDMVKSEKVDNETLLTCLVMLWHEALARSRERERKEAVVLPRRYTPCFALSSESSALKRETCAEVKPVVSCRHVIPHTPLHHSAFCCSHSFSSETEGWVFRNRTHPYDLLWSHHCCAFTERWGYLFHSATQFSNPVAPEYCYHHV